jgi:hypothetical protein
MNSAGVRAERKNERERARSRFHVRLSWRALGVVGLLALASCSELPLPVLGTDGLSPGAGWVVTPTERWLTEPGLTPEALVFCALESCSDRVLVARFALSGREQEIARRIADHPERVFATLPAAGRTRRGAAPKPPSPPPRVSRLSVGGWSGARVALESRSMPGRAAHLVVLARPRDGRLLIAVAPEADRAEEAARAAVR